MSQTETIARLLEEAARRRRRRRAWHGAFHGLLGASGLCLLMLAAWKLLPLPLWVPVAAVAVLPLGLLAGALAAAWQRPDTLETARWLDQCLNLQERLSTAWEWRHQNNPWSQLVLQDAARHAAECPPERLPQWLPWTLPRHSRWTLLSLGVAAALSWVPEYRSPAREQAALEKANLAETGRRMVEIIKHQMQVAPPALPPTQKALEDVVELGEQWSKNPPLRTEALREAAQLAAQLQKQISELEKNPGLKKLEKTARQTDLETAADPVALQRKVDELQNQLGAAAGQGEKLQNLQQRLEKARAAAENLARAENAEAEAARQQLAQALADLQKEAAQLGHNLEGLDAALKALTESKPGQVLKDLDAALQDLAQLRDLAQKLEKLQKNLAQTPGKNLAEQLELGQAGAAIKTLERMKQQLLSAQLSPEQLQKIMEELAAARQPAGEYGKLEEKLEAALKALQTNRRDQAAQHLDEAIKELEDLLNQMNDADALADALRILRLAEEAAGQGQCLGQCRGKNPPRAGKSSCRGQGVGDWADDPWAPEDFQLDELWDNSGVLRPDQPARGHTDRALEKPDHLDPATVRGKINPGQPMPSVTLKGVGIKGASKIEWEEAAAAAQTEAQNALNQDQVPRAYRQQVKEYFDDLK